MQPFQLILQVFHSEVAVSRVNKLLLLLAANHLILQKMMVRLMCKKFTSLLQIKKRPTRVILYLKYTAQKGSKSAVVRVPDTNIFFILLHHSSSIGIEIILDNGSG